MPNISYHVHKLLLSCIFSLGNWLLINTLLVDISIIKYIIVELIVLISLKCFIFTARKILPFPNP